MIERVPAPVMSLALMMRFASQGRGEYADRVLGVLREYERASGGNIDSSSSSRSAVSRSSGICLLR